MTTISIYPKTVIAHLLIFTFHITQMPTIHLETIINSTLEICFDLSRSIDLHVESTATTNETAISGITTGLIGIGESVTWQATHFGIRQRLTSHITAYNRPYHFCDEQVKGAFRYFVHDHYFESRDGHVVMKDTFRYRAPFGILGTVAERLVLTNYLTKLLTHRNNLIKKYAETGKWQSVLPSTVQ